MLVTGSAGSIGSEICRQLLSLSPRRIIAVDRSENGQFFLEHQLRSPGSDVQIDFHIADVLDKDAMRNILDRYKPEVIFHAAAYKHVPLMEAHPGEAVKNIVTATRQMADLAVETGVKSFVLDLDRQSRQSDQRDGGLQTHRRIVSPIAARPHAVPFRDGAIRQRHRFRRQRRADLPPADRRRRAGHGDGSRRFAAFS